MNHCIFTTFTTKNILILIFLRFCLFIFIFLKILFIFQQRGRKGERESKKHPCVVASHVPPPGDLACNPGLCPDWKSNQRPFGSQAGTQSTELHQPGLFLIFLICIIPDISRNSLKDIWFCFRAKLISESWDLVYH